LPAKQIPERPAAMPIAPVARRQRPFALYRKQEESAPSFIRLVLKEITMNPCLLRLACGFAASVLAFNISVTAEGAARPPALHTYAGPLVFIPGIGSCCPIDVKDDATGPLASDVEAGAVLAYRYPGQFPDFELETTLFAESRARADYGTNGASVKVGLRPVIGDDRSAFPGGDYLGNLPHNSSVEPQGNAESVWTDRFVMLGGTGTGTGTVSVSLSGRVQTSYGQNGTIWYDAEPSFQTFGTDGSAYVNYSLHIYYDKLPPGIDPEYGDPISMSRIYLPPDIPDYVAGILPAETLMGSFAFEYGVPFSLSSHLNISGYEQIDIDFDHTATLSMIDLPEGARMLAESGHIYPGSGVPEPSSLFLLGACLLTTAFFRQSSGFEVCLLKPRDTRRHISAQVPLLSG
jgi:hypothetical protein